MEVSVVQITVTGTLSAVSANTDLNENGEDTLTITGTNFSPTPANNVVTFSDGTVCDVTSSTDTTIECETNAFDSANIAYENDAYSLSVTTNSIQATGSQTATLYGIKLNSLSVFPTSVSPILKQWVTVSLTSDYPETLTSTDQFSSSLVCTDVDCDYTETLLWINSVNDADKTL